MFASSSALAETATLRIGWQTPAKAYIVKNGIMPWLRAIEKDADGTLKFQEFFGGQLNRSPAKQLELMMNGVQDVTIVIPSYTQELFPNFSLFSLPYLFRSIDEAATAMWRFYEKGLLKGLDKVYVAAILSNGNSLLHFSKKVEKAGDVKGLKIRAAGPEESAVIKAVGAVPVAMGITQIAESLNRGVIQGALTGFSPAKSFRYLPLIKTHWEEPFGTRGFFLGIKKSVYDKLPDKARQAIDKNSGLAASRKISDAWEQENQMLIKEAKSDPGRNYITLTKAEQEKRFNEVFKRFHEDWVKSNPNGQAEYDALMAIIADIRKGQ
jgi:TRAP-type C4-dicarboxylate transport system substrate-binding protein